MTDIEAIKAKYQRYLEQIPEEDHEHAGTFSIREVGILLEEYELFKEFFLEVARAKSATSSLYWDLKDSRKARPGDDDT